MKQETKVIELHLLHAEGTKFNSVNVIHECNDLEMGKVEVYFLE